MTKKALTLALEALELAGGNLCEALNHPKKLQHGIGQPCPAVAKYDIAITAIKEALAQPEPPPECKTEAEKTAFAFGWFKAMETQRTWVGLTTDDWDEIRKQVKFNFEMTTGEYAERVSHLVEDKLREKNT